MSRGPGKIERAIEALFRERPDDAFTIEDIADRVYAGIKRTDKRHRVSVLRAAKKVCARMADWKWSLSETSGNALVFWNRRNVMSYASSRLKADMFSSYRSKRELYYHPTKSADDIRAMILPGGEDHHLVVEGGAWWRHVQLDIAGLDNDTSDRILLLQAAQDEASRDLMSMGQQVREALGR